MFLASLDSAPSPVRSCENRLGAARLSNSRRSGAMLISPAHTRNAFHALESLSLSNSSGKFPMVRKFSHSLSHPAHFSWSTPLSADTRLNLPGRTGRAIAALAAANLLRSRPGGSRFEYSSNCLHVASSNDLWSCRAPLT